MPTNAILILSSTSNSNKQTKKFNWFIDFLTFFQDKVKKRNPSSETENLKICFSDKALQTDLHKTEEMFPTHDFNQERTEYETKYK